MTSGSGRLERLALVEGSPVYQGLVELTAALSRIPVEQRLDVVATFVRGCIDTNYFTTPGFELGGGDDGGD